MNETAASPVRTRTRTKRAAVEVLLSPVVERELRAALHRRDARKSRLRVAGFGVGGVALFMLFGGLMGSPSWGSTLHFYLFVAGLSLAVGPAIHISVGLFAEERRQQTLELLYLTGMGSVELFIGKLLGGALVASSDLLALAPLIAVPFLSGGLSFDLFAATVACLPTVFVLVLAVGSLASALCKEEGTALVLSYVMIGTACLALPLPYNLGSWLAGTVPFEKTWLVLSPALGPWLVAKNFAGFRLGDFWTWTTVMWCWSAICLTLAAVMLKRNWRRDMERAGADGWQAKWEAFVHGSAAWRAALRRRVLPLNAYQWLAQQDRRPALQAWGFMGAVCAVWLLAWCAWPKLWPGTLNFYSTAVALLFGVEMIVSLAAARRMAVDRRDGALELLLTTPLSPAEMLAGQKAALRDQFRPVRWGLLGLVVLMITGGFLSRSWTVPGVISYLTVWSLFLLWCWRLGWQSAPLPMWVAANCGQPRYGIFRPQGGAWNQFWMVYWIWNIVWIAGPFNGWARSFPGGSTVEMVVVLAAAVWVVVFAAAKSKSSNAMEGPLVAQLRQIAQEPLPERNDPRFKQWKDVRTRFPAPPGGRFGQPGEDLSPAKPVKAAGAWLWRPLGKACGRAWAKLRKAVIIAAP